MPRLRLTLAYDGTDFAGWQSQAPGPRTVQGTLEGSLARLCGGLRVEVEGAGRTDAGVHALGQVATFDLPREMPLPTLVRALNALLPADVKVVDAAEVPAGFHARRSAVSKLYRYVLDTGPVRLPQRRRSCGYVPGTLDENVVIEAAAAYLGEHDFASVASTGSSVKTTVRTVTRSDARFERIEGLARQAALVYEVEASGFLRKMVRSLVGGLVACGRGDLAVDELRARLAAADRAAWPAPAEPCGLTLVRVTYPDGTQGSPDGSVP